MSFGISEKYSMGNGVVRSLTRSTLCSDRRGPIQFNLNDMQIAFKLWKSILTESLLQRAGMVHNISVGLLAYRIRRK